MTTHDYEQAIRDARAADFQELRPGISWAHAQHLADAWKTTTGAWPDPNDADPGLLAAFLYRYGDSGDGAAVPAY